MKTQIVTSQVLADWCGISVRRVRELSSAGVMVKAGPGKFDLKKSITKYMGHLREQAAGRSEIAAAAIELKQANAQLARLKFRKAEGTVIEAEIAFQIWSRIMIGDRNRYLALPGKIFFEVPYITPHDRRRIEQIVRDDLEDAALQHGYDFSGIPGVDAADLAKGDDDHDVQKSD